MKITVTTLPVLKCWRCAYRPQQVEVIVTDGSLFVSKQRLCQVCANRYVVQRCDEEADFRGQEAADLVDHEDAKYD